MLRGGSGWRGRCALPTCRPHAPRRGRLPGRGCAPPPLRRSAANKSGAPRPRADPPGASSGGPRLPAERGARQRSSPRRRQGGYCPAAPLTGTGAAAPAPPSRGGPLAHTEGRVASQHPRPVTGGAAPLTSARRPAPLRLLRSAAAQPNNSPYSGSGGRTAPARGAGRGLRPPLPRGAPREA